MRKRPPYWADRSPTGLVEVGQAAEHDQRRQQRAAEAVEDAGVEERPADEGIRAADQLGDLDFRPALLDLEPDGVADDGEHAQARAPR